MKNKICGILIICMSLLMGACHQTEATLPETQPIEYNDAEGKLPVYQGQPYAIINRNEPRFSEEDDSEDSYEAYAELDALVRCGVAEANIGVDIMPTEERQNIGQVKPSGWHTVKYDHVEGKYLYNRCHLIGFQLTGENANEKNLITGTRYLNTEGMLPFENMVADYVKETENHVRYRVTPIFEGDNLVASGVYMEARSVEDDGDGICFAVYVFNVQPGVEIDYATGESWASEETSGEQTNYILNKNNKKFHKPDCSSVSQMKEENKQEYKGSRENLIKQGYAPCGNCMP